MLQVNFAPDTHPHPQSYYCFFLWIFSMQESKQTRDMFLTLALQRILSDKEIRRSHNSGLKEECKKTLGEFMHSWRVLWFQNVNRSCFLVAVAAGWSIVMDMVMIGPWLFVLSLHLEHVFVFISERKQKQLTL